MPWPMPYGRVSSRVTCRGAAGENAGGGSSSRRTTNRAAVCRRSEPVPRRQTRHADHVAVPAHGGSPQQPVIERHLQECDNCDPCHLDQGDRFMFTAEEAPAAHRRSRPRRGRRDRKDRPWRASPPPARGRSTGHASLPESPTATRAGSLDQTCLNHLRIPDGTGIRLEVSRIFAERRTVEASATRTKPSLDAMRGHAEA